MPKVVAKPLSLTVRPFQVSHLCFEVGGILGRSLAELGTQVSAFDFDHLYNAFREANTNQAVDPGRLEFNSDGIDAQTIMAPVVGARPPALAVLRAEPVKAALNKAVTARENAFITKYGKVTENASFLKAAASGRTGRLARLSKRSQQRTDKLLFAYSQPGIGRNENDVVTKTTTDVMAKRHEEPFVTTTEVVSEKITNSRTFHEAVVRASAVQGNDQAGAVEIQKIENTGYEFRMPFVEEDMRNDWEQIRILDQRVSDFLQSHYLDRLEEVYKNELASIDADVNQLQVAYLNTILMSPIDGIVTGVYKNPGDVVSPGEPVFRVENNADVLIVANVACRGPISVGSMLQVKTTLFDLPDSPVTVEAEIVSVRGAGEDDQWEVIAKRKNTDNAGKGPLFPLGYTFDYDNTEVAIFGAGEI
jgi:hypothetical protein